MPGVTTPERIFIDLDIDFTRNPITGDVSVRKEGRAISQSIRSLILTRKFERPFQPELGSDIFSKLFDNIDAISASELEEEIERTILIFEKRARIGSVTVEPFPEKNTYVVTIIYGIENRIDQEELSITLTKSR